MKQGDSFYQTRDTRLVAALTAVGIELSEVQPFGKYINDKTGKTQIVWHIELQSPDGKYKTNDLVAAYHDPFLMKKEESNLQDFAHAVASLKNREQLMDIVNNSEGIREVWKNDEIWLVPENSKVTKEIL